MGGFLRQATAAQSRAIGSFVSDSDFKTVQTSLTIANTDIKLIINGAASANKNSGGGTHRANGVYGITFDATDTATVGEMELNVLVSGALVVFDKFFVLEEVVFDALFAASAPGYLQPTTAGRTLDVSAGGEAGIDWANIGSPNTAQNLSATNIDVDQIVASVSGAVGSVTGAVGSVTGAVGSVTGNVGGNVVGSVASVTGNVGGNVVGSVASVTGNVGGNVVGSVASVTGNVGGNVTGSVGSVVGAVGSVTGSVGSVTGNVGGNVTGSVGSVAAGGIASTSFAANSITAAAVASDVGTELADALLKRDWTAVTGESSRSVLNALRFLRNKWSIAGGTLTVTTEDDSTTAWTGAVVQTAGNPVSSIDPT